MIEASVQAVPHNTELGFIRDLEWFLSFAKLELSLSEATLRTYRNSLGIYLAWLAEQGVRDLGTVDLETIERFLNYRQHGRRQSTLANTVAAVRTFHKHLALEGRLLSNPAEKLQQPKVPSGLPHPLNLDEIMNLLKCAEAQIVPVGLRDRALIELLYGTGARISEIVSLDIDAISETENLIRLVGKGNKQRIVPFGSYARSAINDYLESSRPELLAKASRSGFSASTSRLFLSNYGKHLTRQQAGNIIRTLGKSAGINRSVSPHSLRHSFATHILQAGADIRTVQELLGHSSINTTSVYTKITVDTLREVYITSHPRAL